MPEPPSTFTDRLERLERQLLELRRRLDALEQQLALRTENPKDRTGVREKVVFDWQS